MSMNAMDFVMESTATQLGIKKDDVTLETIIPDIFTMSHFACVKLGKVIQVNDFTKQYTVEEAIEMFEA